MVEAAGATAGRLRKEIVQHDPPHLGPRRGSVPPANPEAAKDAAELADVEICSVPVDPTGTQAIGSNPPDGNTLSNEGVGDDADIGMKARLGE
jgi:hypothetical protein